MRDRFLLKIVASIIAISLMVVAIGVIAAWNVQRQQAVNSMLIAREVEGMLAAQAVDVGMREIRHQLNQYVRRGEQRYFDRIQSLHEETAAQLEKAKELARTAEEQELIAVVDRGYRRFWEEFQRINAPDYADDRRQALGQLVDQTLTDAILTPGQKYIDFNRQVVRRTSETSRMAADQMRQGFLLLGICGGAGGLIAGLGIARALSRSIVQLDVSVQSAAGRLSQVAGPVRISRVGGLRELEAGLQSVENHIAAVVERLQQSELEVLRNEQLAAVGQLAAGIAHELRNPLMPMKMLVQAALERDDGVGLTGRPLQVVEEEIGRLERSIQMLLDFARPPIPEKSRFDLVSMVEQKLDLVSGRADRQQVQLREDLPSGPVLIEADCGQIQQVVVNLLLNALDAISGGGQVRVSVETVSDTGDAPPGGGWAVVRIADTGPGLPAEMLDRAFEPFVTTKETGTGLGLSICRRIVVAHGGQISACNLPQGGAEFTVRLPWAPSLALADIAAPAFD